MSINPKLCNFFKDALKEPVVTPRYLAIFYYIYQTYYSK